MIQLKSYLSKIKAILYFILPSYLKSQYSSKYNDEIAGRKQENIFYYLTTTSTKKSCEINFTGFLILSDTIVTLLRTTQYIRL
mgnify:CR=1 FL=1